MNIGKAIGTVILVIVFLAVSVSLYPTYADYIDNVTGSGYTGTGLLVVAKVLYWIIASAAVILAIMEGFGLFGLMKKFDRLK